MVTMRIKASEIDSPCNISVPKDKTSVSGLSLSSVVNNANRQSIMKPQLYSVSTECGNYEELSTEQKKRTKIDPCIEVCQAETEVQPLTIDDGASVVSQIKTPMDRLLNNLETTIRKLSADLENKETTLTHLNDLVKNALSQNDGNLPICGQCHLREVHTKRNCLQGECPSAKSCGLIEKKTQLKKVREGNSIVK